MAKIIDTYCRLIAPGKNVDGVYHYPSQVKQMYLYSIKLLSRDGETVIIRPKTRNGNYVSDNIDGCLMSFEHFLYDCTVMSKVSPIGCTTLPCDNKTGNTVNAYNGHNNHITIPNRGNCNYNCNRSYNYNINGDHPYPAKI